MLVAACTPEVNLGVDLQYANVRVPYQTDPSSVLVYPGDVDAQYDVLSDVEIVVRQRSAFGDLPTIDSATRALQEQAGRIGAHALIHVQFGKLDMSLWSYNELRGHGRAIRFR